MLFQMKFQFQIRQKCRFKWNDIGHALELGPKMQPRSNSMAFVTSQLVTLGTGWNSKIPGRYSNHGSQKFFETGLGSQTQK